MKTRLFWTIAAAVVGLAALALMLASPDRTSPSGQAAIESPSSPPPFQQREMPTHRPPVERARSASTPRGSSPALRGQVVTAHGAPLRGVAVSAYQAETGEAYAWTDDSGRFVFNKLPRGDFRVSVEAPGYNAAVLDGVPYGSSDVRLVVSPLSALMGRVVAADSGLPIRKFDVIVVEHLPVDESWWQDISGRDSDRWQPVTSPAGRFKLGELPSEQAFAVGARAAGFAPAFVELDPVAPGEIAAPVKVALERGAAIVGRVVDRSHRPVDGVELHLGDDDQGPLRGSTDADGRFLLADLGLVPVDLTLTHPDYVTKTLTLLPEQSPTEVEIILRQGGRIDGGVFLADAPVQDALVVAGTLGRGGFQRLTRSDAGGRFRIAGLPPGEAEVFAELPQDERMDTPVARLQQQVLLEDGAATRLVFRFPISTGALEGFIRVAGRAPASATLRGTTVSDHGDAFFSAEARRDGSYQVDGVMPGDAWIEVVATLRSGALRRDELELAIPEGALIRQDFDLPGGAVIAGIVLGLEAGDSGEVMVLPDGITVDAADLESLSALHGLRTASAPLRPDGRFRVDGVAPGDYTLLALVFRADGPDGEDPLSSVRLGTTTVFIEGDKPVNVTLELTR